MIALKIKGLLALLLLTSLLSLNAFTLPVEASPAEPQKTPKGGKATRKKPAPSSPANPVPEGWKQLSPETQNELQRLNQAMQEEAKAISNELQDDEELSVKDIAMLWQASVERSGTLRYAIERLSRRDATGKPVSNDSFTKRVLQSIVHVGGVAGSIWTGTPAGMIGGNMVQEMLQDSPTDSALTRITDADMLILAKEVEALQTKLIETYYSYRHAETQWKLAQEAKRSLFRHYQRALEAEDSQSVALRPLLESLREGLEEQETMTKQDFISQRNALGLLVGQDALAALEKAHQESATRQSD